MIYQKQKGGGKDKKAKGSGPGKKGKETPSSNRRRPERPVFHPGSFNLVPCNYLCYIGTFYIFSPELAPENRGRH